MAEEELGPEVAGLGCKSNPHVMGVVVSCSRLLPYLASLH